MPNRGKRNEKDLENVTGGMRDDAGIEQEAEQYLKGIQRRQCASCKREDKSPCQAHLKRHYIASLKNGITPVKKCSSYK